jgi:outer membrane receptor protein involved in Fe transport
MMGRPLIFCVLLVLAASFSLQASPIIRGKIVDKSNRLPIEAADVMLLSGSGETVVAQSFSDASGVFSIAGVRVGMYRLRVRMIGYDLYELAEVGCASAGDDTDVGTVELMPLEIGLSEVVVAAGKRQVVYKLDKRVVSGSNSLASSGGTAVEILENMPSIRVDAEGGVTFRGSSGFRVYIDGQPSMFSGTQALQQVPAGLIEDIEIITTPSARHEAAGETGIINIITKKSALEGLSGMANMSGSTALSNGVDFLLFRKLGRLQWRLSGYWNMPVRESSFSQDKTTLVGGVATSSRSDGPRRSASYRYGASGGLDYNVDDKTTLHFVGDISYGDNTRQGDLDYRESRLPAGVVGGVEENRYRSVDSFYIYATVFQGQAGFERTFAKGERLTGNFLLAYQGDPVEYFQSDLFDGGGLRRQGHRAWEDELRWTVLGNIDYVKPVGERSRIEAGYMYYSYLEDGDYSMQFWDSAKSEFYWRDDIYNTFYFQRGIHSLYAMAATGIGKVDMQAGLRGEHTHVELRSSVNGADRLINAIDLYPSVHASWGLPREQKLSVAYSYRINPPALFYMEPYITYRDYYTAEIGNPDILPEYIHSFELGYTKTFGEQFLSATAFTRSRRDKIERLRVPFQAGVTLDSMANVGRDRSTGIELNGQFRINSWWNLNVLGNAYYYEVDKMYKAEGAEETSTNYDATLNNLFTVGRGTRIQLDGNFVGPSVTTQGSSGSFWFVNFSVRHQFFANLSGTLTFRDALNSARYRSDIRTADLSSFTRIRPNYPVISLTLSYTFNNYKTSQGVSRDNRDLFEGTKH